MFPLSYDVRRWGAGGLAWKASIKVLVLNAHGETCACMFPLSYDVRRWGAGGLAWKAIIKASIKGCGLALKASIKASIKGRRPGVEGSNPKP